MLPSGFSFQKYYDAVDSLLDHPDIGRPCTVFYSASKVACADCTGNTLAGGFGGNTYKSGGPAPFHMGNCQYCGGTGFKEVENTDTLNARVYWRPQDWIRVANIDIAQYDLQIIFYMSDVHKVMRAEKIRVYNDLGEYFHWDCALDSQPVPHGFGDRYAIAMLKRV